jgi:OmpA-OmpF porin, OOP family
MKKTSIAILTSLLLVFALLTGCAGTNSSSVIRGVDACAIKPVAVVTPPAPVAVVKAPVVMTEIIYFDFDKINIKASEQPKIDRVANLMKANGGAASLIVGHTDKVGTEKYNMGLSERRAKAVKAALVKAGVDEKRISIDWKGESQLTGGANAQDRRAVVTITIK